MKKRVYPYIKPIPFTQEGLDKIKQEHEELMAQRPDALHHLQKARELGDLKENGYYQASRAKLNMIDGRLRRINHLLKYGFVSENADGVSVQIGTIVTITDGKTESTYSIVGAHEASPAEKKLSTNSPIIQPLLGKKVNDEVTIEIPIGKVTYKVISIKAA